MSRKTAARPDLAARLRALDDALTHATGLVDDDARAPAEATLARAGARRQLSATHTVVALAGATGSGKSSLFNALAQIEIAEVGVRRPTTSEPTACIWGDDNAGPLLQWLQIPHRRQVPRRSALDGGDDQGMDGLVLIDLPDHDSTTREHRRTVDRLVDQVDLFVWVLDPQKYADAVLHEQYLQPLAGHAAVTVIVLNQTDLLAPEELERCVAHLHQLLAADGMADVEVLTTSARIGTGVEALRQRLAELVAANRAAEDRLQADVGHAAAVLADAVGPAFSPQVTDQARAELADALADAAGADAVATAAARSYRHRGHLHTGWPATRWLRRLRPDPVQRLGLDRSDLRPDLRRSSRPAATPVQRARADTGLRTFGDRVVDGATGPLAQAVRTAANPSDDALFDRLDQAVTSVEVTSHTPRWWRAVSLLQWLFLALALVGGGWLLGLFGLSLLQIELSTPTVGVVPVPTLLLVAGLLAGLLLTVGSAVLLRAGAARRERSVRTALRRAVDTVVEDTVVQPVQEQVETVDQLHAALVRSVPAR